MRTKEQRVVRSQRSKTDRIGGDHGGIEGTALPKLTRNTMGNRLVPATFFPLANATRLGRHTQGDTQALHLRGPFSCPHT